MFYNEVGSALRADLAAFIRGLRPRVGARLRLALLNITRARQSHAPTCLCPGSSVLCTPYSVICPLAASGRAHLSTFAQAVGRFAPSHGLRIFPSSALRTLSSAFTFPLLHRPPADFHLCTVSATPQPPTLPPTLSPTLPPTPPPTLPPTLPPTQRSIPDSFLDSSLDPALHFTARKRVEAAFFHATLGRLVFTPSFTIVA